MGAVSAIVEAPFKAVEAVGTAVGNAAKDVGNFVSKEVIQPVAKTVEKTVQAAIDDPIGTAAKVATAIYAPELLPLTNAGVALAHGASPEDVLKSAAVTMVTQNVAEGVGDYVKPEMAETFTNPVVASAATNATASVAAAVATGKDPLQALVTSGANSAASVLAPEIPGYDSLSKTQQTAVKTTIAYELQGKDPSQALVNQVIKTVTNYIKDEVAANSKADKAAAFDQQVAAMKVDQLSNVDLQAEKEAFINNPDAKVEDATSAVQTAATKSDQDKVDDVYQEFKRAYAGDISDEDLRAAAQAHVMKAEGKGDGVSIDAYAMRAFNAQSAADQAAQMGLSYEIQRGIKENILDQDISSWSKDNSYQYDASDLIKAAESATSLGMEFAKADAEDGSFAEATSQYLRDQEARDSQLWIQDQADMIGMKDNASIKDIIAKIDSGEYNSAEAYSAFRAAEAVHANETIQKDPTAKTAYDSALKYAKDNGLTDDAASKQWAYDIATGLKNYQDFNTIKALPETAAALAQQAKDMYGLNDADAKAISDRVLSGELNYNDALTVSKNVSMARQLGETSKDLAYEAPTLLDKGAELELKAANFEKEYDVTADTPEELAALEVAKNNILNNFDSQSVYNDYMSGKYAEIDLTEPTPTTVNEDGVNEPFTYPVVPDLKPDYSLDSNITNKLGVDPETGTGLTAPSALTNVNDLVDPNYTTDYSLYNPAQDPYSGLGLKLPTSPGLAGMGGGQGLTADVTDPETGEQGTVGELRYTPEGASPVLGDPESPINDPEVLGKPVMGLDPAYLSPLAVQKPVNNAVVVGSPTTLTTSSNLPRGTDVAARPANASGINPDGTEATPTWKPSLLVSGMLGSTYNPNADYSFQSNYTPQNIDISQQSPLQQLNPAFQDVQPQADASMPQTQNTSGYYNYGVDKSPLSFDSSPFYASSTPQIAHLRGGGLARAARGVPYKGSHYVQGEGGGQDDLIDARLADGEYVFDADIVAALGDGSNKEGAKKLDAMRESIRKQKRSAPVNRIPPKAKSPLAYLKGAR